MVNALGKWDCVNPHGVMVATFILLSFHVSGKSEWFILCPRATFLKLITHFFFFPHVRVTIIASLWNTFWEVLFLIEYYDTCWGQRLERDFMETDFWFSVIKKNTLLFRKRWLVTEVKVLLQSHMLPHSLFPLQLSG